MILIGILLLRLGWGWLDGWGGGNGGIKSLKITSAKVEVETERGNMSKHQKGLTTLWQN